MLPSLSDELDALKDTANGAVPEVGVAVKLAVGDWLVVMGGVVPPPLQPDKNIANVRNKTTKKYFLTHFCLSAYIVYY